MAVLEDLLERREALEGFRVRPAAPRGTNGRHSEVPKTGSGRRPARQDPLRAPREPHHLVMRASENIVQKVEWIFGNLTTFRVGTTFSWIFTFFYDRP